jgi:adenylate cyclase
VTPLLPPHVGPASVAEPRGGAQGRERPIVAMFVDLRDSTRLGEGRLPYDVVFIMNQFFAEMNAALRATGGYYAQFRGDGLLALYDWRQTCCRVGRGRRRGRCRTHRGFNRSLAADLAEPLRIGIGIHAGVAIVGTMGPPDAPIYSAIGDMVNTAARLEGMTKAYGCVLVVSAEALQQAGIEQRLMPAAPGRVAAETSASRLRGGRSPNACSGAGTAPSCARAWSGGVGEPAASTRMSSSAASGSRDDLAKSS